MRRLIINADDFGLTRGINRAIAELHDAGALTSATLMAAGPAFSDAVQLALARPTLGIGCHIMLVDGSPVSDPAAIPTLVRRNGRFREGIVEFVRDLYCGRIALEDIERETIAQIQKLQQAGISVTHVDTHKHVHMFPRVTSVILCAACECRVQAVRNPFEEPWSRQLVKAKPVRLLEVTFARQLRKHFESQPLIINAAVLTTSGTIGIAVMGTLNAEALTRMFDAMPPGTWELACHPGYNDSDLDHVNTWLRESREVELRALQQKIPRLLMQHSDVSFIHYGKLGAAGSLREDGCWAPDTGHEKIL